MPKVRGIGGIFFKTTDPEALNDWYRKHLGIEAQPNQGAMFKWRQSDDPSKEELTVWATFPASTDYFGKSKSDVMVNYIVDDLDTALEELRAQGVQVDEHVERCDYGNFGWITDPAGNRIELWQPKP